VPEAELTVTFHAEARGNPVEGAGAPPISLGNGVVIDEAVLWLTSLRVVSDAGETLSSEGFSLDLREADAAARFFEAAPGLYSRVRFAVAVPLPTDEDVPPALALPDGTTLAIRLVGTANGVPFDYREASAVDLDLRDPGALDLGPGNRASFDVLVDLDAWIGAMDLSSGELVEGVILIDAVHNLDLAESLRMRLSGDTLSVMGQQHGS
jgi:hypothetical protein